MESGGKCRIVSGSQEVIGSIPICSTKIIRGLQISEFVTLSFLPVFCQTGEKVVRPFGNNNSSSLSIPLGDKAGSNLRLFGNFVVTFRII